MDDRESQVTEIAAWLRDRDHAEPCAFFPADAARAAQAGMYAWHGDGVALALAQDRIHASPVNPMYAGQAGATSAIEAKESLATLESRIGANHLRGNTRASTFRRTLAALLWDELELRCAKPRTLEPDGNQRLTTWMGEHLAVAIAPVGDRVALGSIEDSVLEALDPPLNLNKVARTASRSRLREIRRLHLAG